MALSGSKSRRSGSRNRNSAISKGTSCTESTVMIDKPSSRGRSRSLGGSRKRSGVSITNSFINDDNAPQSRGNSKSRVTASGGGMTIWWITAVCLTLFLRFEQTVRKEIFKWNVESSVLDVILSWLIRTSKGETPSEIALSLLRGVCCVTGLAVGVGYYTFKVCFRYVQGSMSRQLYDHHDLNKLMSYPVFLVLDIATHIGVVCAITYYWARHVTPAACLLSFIFHRLWSITFSRGTTLFYERVELVYGFRERMPRWSFVLLYGSEMVVLSASIIATST